MICVVGGSGFIGTRLCRRLASAHKPFRIVDKQASVSFPEKTTIADARSLDQLRSSIGAPTVLVHLAAEHRDDVRPKSLYDEVNIQGADNLCKVASEHGIQHIIFTSSVAVYGFSPPETDESGSINYFNDYGRTKFEAEKIFTAWQREEPQSRILTIVRPTVVFGEQNRGNVYNLLRQIASGKFLMIGSGNNKKSMAYVENVAAFIEYVMSFKPGIHVYNYIDKPDLTMNELVLSIRSKLGRKRSSVVRIPYYAGLLGGFACDAISRLTGRPLPVSSIRVKKFCATTQFGSSASATGFVAPVSLMEGIEKTVAYEFLEAHENEQVFYTE